jgi:hypothetical protein
MLLSAQRIDRALARFEALLAGVGANAAVLVMLSVLPALVAAHSASNGTGL